MIMKHLIFTCLLILGLALQSLHAQTRLIEAFSQSYLLEQQGQYQAAIDTLLDQYDASSYETNLRLGWLYYLAEQFPAAQQYYQQAISLMPYAIEPKLGIVYPLSAIGNWTAVIGQYEKILQIDPHHTTAHYRLAAIYYEKQLYQEALPHIESVINLYPFDYDALVLYGWIQVQAGNTAKAKVLFHKALLYNPEGDLALAGLGSLPK